ncbi:SDR family NAD(P)-dependent oxidoreductase [Dongia soli]|uniref:SDR family oxidoreductase n=1 Tax=Dongia soli TaxID=600628 RepID=A0ABU5ECE0_9PROT|nr:SDR family oxidoreductase [Dongia soli]MDY0883552.1 SDR family oxidoreductase [Dongia soli]
MSGGAEPPGRLAGKVILLTGAASGIGSAITRRCLEEGASLACLDRDMVALRSFETLPEEQILLLQCDVTDATAIKQAVDHIRDRFGRLDGLVHNAAAPSADGTVVDLDPAQWQLEIGVSLTGAFLVSKCAIPLIAQSGGGAVVFIASQFGRVATGQSVAYCAAKAGLIHLAKAMAVDHAAQGIRVNSLSPGAVATARLLQRAPDLATANARLGPAHLLGRIAEPSEIAAAAAFLLSSDASFVTGTDLLADGGYAAR